jgi:hypothetical protein
MQVKTESSSQEKASSAGDMSDFRLPLQRIHQEIHAVDVALEETFEQLAK